MKKLFIHISRYLCSSILESKLKEARKQERTRMWDAINKHIPKEQLKGNGCDEVAQRNGMVLAANIIYGFVNK